MSMSYRVDQWTTDHGLPSHVVQDIDQTSDGYLWVATTGGLARFDGVEFRVLTAEDGRLSTPRTAAIHVTPGDTLWITLEGPSVARLVGEQLTEFPGQRFIDIGQDKDGAVFAVFQRGLARFDGQRFRTIGTMVRRQARYRGVARLPQVWLDGVGNTWVHGHEQNQVGLYRLVGDQLERTGGYQQGVLVPIPSRQALAHVRTNGQVTEVSGADNHIFARYRTSETLETRHIDRNDRVWVATDAGLNVYGPDSAEPIARLHLEDGIGISRVFEDREGNVWIGTGGSGLFRIQKVPFQTWSANADGTRQVRDLTRGEDGGVLAIYASNLRPLLQFGSVTLDTVRSASRQPRALAAPTYLKTMYDSRGTMWSLIASPSSPHTLRGERSDGPDITITGRSEYSFDHRVRLLTDDAPVETLWFVDGDLVHRVLPYALSDSTIAETYELTGEAIVVHDLMTDEGHALWVLASRDGIHELLRLADGGSERYTIPEDVLPVPPRALAAGSNGVIWIGTYGAGIIRFHNGTFRTVDIHDGLAEETASEILFDDFGNLWMAGNRSIHRASEAELNEFLDGRIERIHGIGYNRRDGILNPETSGGEAFRGLDGRLWFPTMIGAAVVQPSLALALDSVPPIVHVQTITVGDTSINTSVSVTLNPGIRRFDIEYNATSLRHPERLQFEYQLVGFDPDWIHAGSDRRATYTNVPPGDYAFRVRAMNAGGVWSERDGALSLTLSHYFYETQWFLVFVVVGISVSTYSAYAYRIRVLKRRETTLNALVDRRTSELAISMRKTEDALATVADQADQLRSLDETKSRFFANVSHEFRTPLSLILGPLQDVKDGRHGEISGNAGLHLSRALQSGRRLTRLVEQLLDIARLEAGVLQMRAEPQDLVPFLRRCTEAFSSMAEREGIEFRVSCPVGGIRVRFDPDQVDKVLANLLGNALKFTPKGGRVEVFVRTEDSRGDEWAVVEVKDTGPGIPQEQIKLVFDRFHQVDDSARRVHAGAGIGLALTKELVELHNGTISVESQEGVGSTFTVRLPVSTEPAGESDSVTARPARWSRLEVGTGLNEKRQFDQAPTEPPGREDLTTVLIVEDSVDLREYLREHLQHSYRVLEAATGVEGLAQARKEVPDLIISDVMMPVMDGNALCEAVKSDAETDFIPVILLTAKASIESRLTGLEGGADDYLTKPVDVRELLVRAHNLIESRRRLRERFSKESRTLPTLPAAKTPGLEGSSAALVDKLYAVMAENIENEAFQVEALAKAMNMSRSTLYRRVDRAIGASPLDLLLTYRLEQAAQWLQETDANVSEIAYGVGFKSVPHFCTRFKEHFGVTPSTYRNAPRIPRNSPA